MRKSDFLSKYISFHAISILPTKYTSFNSIQSLSDRMVQRATKVLSSGADAMLKNNFADEVALEAELRCRIFFPCGLYPLPLRSLQSVG